MDKNSTRKHCSFVATETPRSARTSLGNGFGLVIPATVTASLASTYSYIKTDNTYNGTMFLNIIFPRNHFIRTNSQQQASREK